MGSEARGYLINIASGLITWPAGIPHPVDIDTFHGFVRAALLAGINLYFWLVLAILLHKIFTKSLVLDTESMRAGIFAFTALFFLVVLNRAPRFGVLYLIFGIPFLFTAA